MIHRMNFAYGVAEMFTPPGEFQDPLQFKIGREDLLKLTTSASTRVLFNQSSSSALGRKTERPTKNAAARIDRFLQPPKVIL